MTLKTEEALVDFLKQGTKFFERLNSFLSIALLLVEEKVKKTK